MPDNLEEKYNNEKLRVTEPKHLVVTPENSNRDIFHKRLKHTPEPGAGIIKKTYYTIKRITYSILD